MEILKLIQLEHSGQGENATHKKVISEFNKSIDEGVYYCKRRGWDVSIHGGLLKIISNVPFGFRMVAKVKA